MTCVVGYLDKDKTVYMGADSAGVDSNFNFSIRKDEKVFLKDNMIFGFTSSFRMGQLLRYSLVLPEHSAKKDTMTYMCTDFIEAVRECFKTKGYSNIKGNTEEGGFFLVGYKGQLFKIECDFQVGVSELPYDAVGCGADFALGSIYSLSRANKNFTPETLIETALESASMFSAAVKPPFLILKLKNN